MTFNLIPLQENDSILCELVWMSFQIILFGSYSLTFIEKKISFNQERFKTIIGKTKVKFTVVVPDWLSFFRNQIGRLVFKLIISSRC